MAITTPVIKSWGEINIPAAALAQVTLELDNAVDALVSALVVSESFVVWGDPDFWDPWGGSGSDMANEFAGQRLSYMETLHNLTNAPCEIFQVYAGVTTESGFNTQLALRAGTPLLVFRMIINDTVNGDTHTYVFAEQALDITGLYEDPVFTGVVTSWEVTLGTFLLEMNSTERSESKELPSVVVTPVNWPNAGDAQGAPYPIVYGTPGTALDSDKIGSGLGASPAVPVDPTSRKYVVAGHALTSIGGQTDEAQTIAAFVRVEGYDLGLAYIEGLSFDKSDTDADGNVIAHVSKDGALTTRLFIPTTADGRFQASTCTDPTNATGRDASTEASLAPGELLSLTIGGGVGTLAQVRRVNIRGSLVHSDLQVRWIGASATIVGSSGSGPTVDSIDGFDDPEWNYSFKVEISGTIYTYTGITQLTSSTWRLNISAYGGPSSGTVYFVGAWTTIDALDMDVYEGGQRAWRDADLGALDLQIKNTSGVNTHAIAFLGLLVEMGEVEVTRAVIVGSKKVPVYGKVPGKVPFVSGDRTEIVDYRTVPVTEQRQVIQGEAVAGQLAVPCAGRAITLNSVSYGASRNPAVQLADFYIQELGFSESDLGDTVFSAISLLAGWNMDWTLAAVANSRDIIDEVMRQARMFEWRDGENKIQFGVIRTDAASDVVLGADDLIDPDGESVHFEPGPVDAVYNRVYLRWGTKTGAAAENLYYITENDSNPSDLQRQGLAQTSIDAHRVTRTLDVSAPLIQDADTALRYLQFLFDFYRTRRRRSRFRTLMHQPLRPGQVARLVVSDLGITENHLVQEVTREGDQLVCEGLAVNVETGLDEAVGYEATATTALGVGWGNPDFWDPWGGSINTEGAETTGRVVDYGLTLLANRHFQDTSEKIAYAAWGTGVTALSAGQTALATQLGTRSGIGPVSRAGTEVTIRLDLPTHGTERDIDEVGIFTGATGNNMVARVVFGSSVNVPAGNVLVVYLRIRLKRPTGSTTGITDYGLDLFAQRVTEDTSEKPTHMAIGTDATAQDASDTTLVAQVSSRVAIHADYPQVDGMTSDYRGDYPAGTYGGTTVAEFGIFTASTGGNAIVRKVPDDTVAIGALDDFVHRHRITAQHYI